MQESHGKGPASHPDPESCVGGREAGGEALTAEYGRGNPAASTQRRKCTPKTTRLVALARLCRHREAFLKPRLPERCLAGDGSGRLIAVKVEVQRDHARAATVKGAEGGDARPWLVEPQQGVVQTLDVVL